MNSLFLIDLYKDRLLPSASGIGHCSVAACSLHFTEVLQIISVPLTSTEREHKVLQSTDIGQQGQINSNQVVGNQVGGIAAIPFGAVLT